MIHKPHHRIGLTIVVAAAIAAGVMFYSRKIAHEPPVPDLAAAQTDAAPRSPLAPREALTALDGSLTEMITSIKSARAKGDPAKAVVVLSHVDVWRMYVVAAKLAPEDQSMALQELAIIQQRSGYAFPDGSLTPQDQAIISEKLAALAAQVKKARATAPE